MEQLQCKIFTDMKKNILGILLFLVMQSAFAQRTAYHFSPENLFNQGKEMFLEKNYAGAQDLLSKFISESHDEFLEEEAEYMIALSSFYRNSGDSGDRLKEFLDNYPESVHRHRINFLIGSFHFDKKEWAVAKHWLTQSDIDYLTPSEQEDYIFRLAYSDLQLGDKQSAQRYFELLYRNSKKYRDTADYYLGYIDYTNADYDAALKRFERLRNHPEFGEEVAFYTAQTTFFKEKLQEAIQLAQNFLEKYPQGAHSPEMYRVLGNSYFRLGQPTKAISNYQHYFEKTDKPLRGDAYFMGLAYAETNQYPEAIRMFQLSVGDPDALTQNAWVQLGQMYLKTGEKQSAQMAFEAASRYNFDEKASETALFNYALLVHETNFSVFSESITLFENFLRRYPKSVYADRVNDILAETFLTTKDYSAALSAINRIANPSRRILEAKQAVLFQLGAQQFIDGNLGKAISYFDDCIGMGNYDSEARNNAFFWRGESHYRLGNYTNAESDFNTFTSTASPSSENYALGWYNLGYARFKQNRYASAQNAFQRYISLENDKRTPEVADAYNRIGDTYYYNRAFSDAERYYAQAAELNPSVADYAAYQKAFVMGLQHNYQGKIAALEDLMRRFPNSQYFDDALFEKSRALTMLNRENEAISVLQQLVSSFPNSSLASQAGIQLGQLYYNLGEHKRSIDAYKNVIQHFPGTDDAKTALVSMESVYRDMNDIQSYVNYANSLPGGMRISTSKQDSLTYLAAEGLYMRGSRPQAEQALLSYLQNYPNGAYSSDANYYLAVISAEKGNKTQALEYYRKVIDANNPKFLENALVYTADSEFENGDYRTALTDYSKLAGMARSSTNKQIGLMGMVRVQSKLGSYHEVARTATDLLSTGNLSPEIATEARYLRAKAYQQINEVDKAMADFQAIANDTRSVYGAEAQFILADTYLKWKSYDKAEAQVKSFMQKGTPHQYWMARALIVLSDTYAAKGDKFQARQYIESLNANYKGNEADIRQMIDERLKN